MFNFPARYKRNLPHFHDKGTILFLTYRLAGSLPKSVLRNLKQAREDSEITLEKQNIDADLEKKLRAQIRRRSFMKYEDCLNTTDTGPKWLIEKPVADIVRDAILHRHPDQYHLICFTIMPNHVHQIIINHRDDVPIYQTIGRLKSFSAKKANQVIGRSGQFWQQESFDHIVRDGKLWKTIQYVIENPTVAGLVRDWREWPYTWLEPSIKRMM